MIKKVGEFECYINEKTAESLPVPIGYMNPELRKSVDEIISHEYSSTPITDDKYLYETIVIAINVTKNCNLACKYCFNHHKENKSLSYDDAVKFIDIVISSTSYARRYIVDMSGSGEPLIELDKILRIAEYCMKKTNEIHKQVVLQFVCNGTLLAEDTVKKLQDRNVLFGVSIDGNKKAHDKNRVDLGGNGTFKKIMDNVKKIKHREFLGAAVTLNNDNIEIVDDVKLLSKYFSTISIKISRPEPGKSLDIDTMEVEYKGLAKLILKEADKGMLDTLFRLLNGDDFFAKYFFRVFGNALCESRCDAGLGKFSLDTDLNIYTCSGAVGIKDLKIGNLNDGIDFKLGKELQLKTINQHECEECPYKRLCGGECLVVLHNANGVNPDMCKLKKFLIELSLYLKGMFIYKYPDLFDEIFDFLESKTKNSLGDSILTEVSKHTSEYTYLELMKIKENDPDKFNEIKDKCLK